ncbi:hypothetical protein TNIN_31171 [Trichonephila inaurata madagascariensis]|uniref:Uncharacterized protein n=1 Tax=Trichonephila inaurata madagascariensis TaxID=2747483 RepID=A0A8X6YN37_9ARAC|nr:hypothetical protein TNIN_31171 [Trichonephila inaurata madagascariensis]
MIVWLNLYMTFKFKALPVTVQMLQCKAKEVLIHLESRTLKHQEAGMQNLRREGFSLRQRIPICRRLLAYFKDKLVKFQHNVISLRTRYAYEFMNFDMSQNYIVNLESEK